MPTGPRGRLEGDVRVVPELGLSAYTCDDLVHRHTLLDGRLEALRRVVEASAALPLVSVIGIPLEVDNALYNCAEVAASGPSAW